MKIRLISWMAIPALFAACTGGWQKTDLPTGIPVAKVLFESPSIPCTDDSPLTRIAVLPNDNGADFIWSSTDTIGILPNAGAQVYFEMSSGAGTSLAEFDGGGWSLRENAVYACYYPFVGDPYLNPTAIPVSFANQEQTGYSSFPNVRCVLASEGTSAENGALHFSLEMLNTVIRINASLPAGTYVKATLSVDEPLFVASGTFDIHERSITGVRFSKTLEVTLKDFVLSAANTVPIYVMAAPVDLSGKALTLRVFSENGEVYECVKYPTKAYARQIQYPLACNFQAYAPAFPDRERQYLWPAGLMPHTQAVQVAAMSYEKAQPGYDPEAFRNPYLDWFPAPDASVRTGACMILISGKDYNSTDDDDLVYKWQQRLTEQGIQCVNLVYRTPRPSGLSIYQTAWEDGQRAVRLVRQAASQRGFSSDRIGVIGMSAGSHLGLLLASSSQTAAYSPIDEVDDISCHINWAILNAPAYVTTDSEAGTPAIREGYGPGEQLSSIFTFDAMTCSISLHHAEWDPYTPIGSTLIYRKLRTMNIPAELHLYPQAEHAAYGLDRGIEFMTQMGYLGSVSADVELLSRYASDSDRKSYEKEYLWPEGLTPDYQSHQLTPYIEWHIPSSKKTDAIQIIYSGGSYESNDPAWFEVTPARRYLNAMGVTVVTMRYRTPRPVGLPKHVTAWQDLQRAIRKVRSEAPSRGLDPNRIGIMGSSAGGHLTIMGTTSSRHQSYLPVDAIDQASCKVQWAIGIYPAYALTDGLDNYNTTGGNADSAVLAPEFSFDLDTAPMLMVHGDADGWAAMNSVKTWEKLRSMGVPAELHTLATREHCFQQYASPGTGSYTYLGRIGEFIEPYCF